MEVIYYTLMATGLYFASDWVLNRIEVSRGERLKNRNIIFFIIILTLALISGGLFKYLMLTSAVTP